MKIKIGIALMALIGFGVNVNAATDTFNTAPGTGIFPPGFTSPDSGIVYNPILPPGGGHLHIIDASGGNNVVEYEHDTGGFSGTSTSKFDLISWDVLLLENIPPLFGPPNPTNRQYGIRVEGFKSAVSPNDTSATADVVQDFAQGLTGTQNFNANFTGLEMFRVFFYDTVTGISALGQAPLAGDGAVEQIHLIFDDIITNPATVVPIPAAVYLFGSALLGLFSVGRRRAIPLTA